MPFHLWPIGRRSTRREFLAGLALGGAAMAVAQDTRVRDEAEGPWFALVSDTHIHADHRHRAFGQHPAENLRLVVADILARPRRPEGVLINGDLALKEGRAGDYESFLALLDPLRKVGVPLHLTLGNHDDRTRFRAALRGVVSDGTCVEEKFAGAFDAMGRRFVLLDSLDKVDSTPGRLGEAQLGWLGSELDSSEGTPTLVVVHHPPDPGANPKRPDGLVDAAALLEVLRRRPWVEGLIFGHTHRWSTSRVAGLEMVNLPAVAYSFVPDQPLGYCRLDIPAGRPRFTLRDVVRRAGGDGRVYRRRPRHRTVARA